jgi:hypothetical protein
MLNPPGPPGPTMRTLSEVEPRVSVNGLPGTADSLHHITQGGAYKLTGPLTASSGVYAIRISTPDPVSIDLGGFAIQGPGGGGGGGGGGVIVSAPAPGGCAYVEIFDGYIRDFDGDGIDGGTARVLECNDLHLNRLGGGITVHGDLVVEGCLIENCAQDGILWDRLAASSSICIVDDSECRACGHNGITVSGDWTTGAGTLSLTDFDAIGNLADGISIDVQGSQPGLPAGQLTCRIQAVRATVNTGARGLHARASGGASLVMQCEDLLCNGNNVGIDIQEVSVDLIDCVSSHNLGDGMRLDGCTGTVEACSALHNGGNGVHLVQVSVLAKMTVVFTRASDNTGSGIYLDNGVTLAMLDDNVANQNGAAGIRCASGQNLLLRNCAQGNGLDYDVPGGMSVVIVPQAQLAINQNPHANYSS